MALLRYVDGSFGRVRIVLGRSWVDLGRVWVVLGRSWAGLEWVLERPAASLEGLGRDRGARGGNETPGPVQKWLKCVRVVQFSGSGGFSRELRQGGVSPPRLKGGTALEDPPTQLA